MYIDEEQKPEPVGAANFAVAVVLHVLFFALLWFAGQLHFRDKEIVIPMDLTVVVQENLDGAEDEPPPLKPPEPKPPEPKPPEPKPPKPPDPPPPEPKDAVEQIHEKTNVVKKVEEKKPEEPKKTAAELRAERIARMREQAKDVKDRPRPPEPPQPNGRTGRKTLSDAEIARRIAQGYKPGATEQLAPNEESMCLGFLKNAIDEKWREMSPQVGRPGTVLISIRFDRSGRIAASTLAKSCGDATTDAAAMRVVGSVGSVRSLTHSFLERYSKESITIRYEVSSSR